MIESARFIQILCTGTVKMMFLLTFTLTIVYNLLKIKLAFNKDCLSDWVIVKFKLNRKSKYVDILFKYFSFKMFSRKYPG